MRTLKQRKSTARVIGKWKTKRQQAKQDRTFATITRCQPHLSVDDRLKMARRAAMYA